MKVTMASSLQAIDILVLLIWVLSVGLFWMAGLLFATANLVAAPVFDRLDYHFQREVAMNPFLPGLPDQLVWDQVFECLRWQMGPSTLAKLRLINRAWREAVSKTPEWVAFTFVRLRANRQPCHLPRSMLMKHYWIELDCFKHMLSDDLAFFCREMNLMIQKVRLCRIRENFYAKRIRRTVRDTQQELDRLLALVNLSASDEDLRDPPSEVREGVEDTDRIQVLDGYLNGHLHSVDYGLAFPSHLYKRADIDLVYYEGNWGFGYLDDFIPVPAEYTALESDSSFWIF